MDQRMVQNELRRQERERRRQAKRKRIFIRNMILLGGLLGTIGIIILIGYIITGKQEKSDTTMKDVVVAQQETTELEGAKPVNSSNVGEEILESSHMSEGDLILVNDEYPIRDYNEENLVNVGDYLQGICQMKSKDIKLQEKVAIALKEMITDFNVQVEEHDLTVTSGYRDFNSQEALHYQSLADTTSGIFVARPDRSEHHTGLAVDFSLCYADGTSEEYDGTGIYSWINEHCHEYGFIVRYDEAKKDLTGISHEPWHFRYVGKVHAGIMTELKMCLEEYVEFLKAYSYYTNPGQGITNSTKNYSIYYVQSQGEWTNVPVPMSKEYTISGNNKDGYIVTASL